MHYRMFDRCKEISYAMYSEVIWHRCTHFAFLIKNNRIQHIGWNKSKTHPLNYKFPYKPTYGPNNEIGLHAELDVCLKSRKDNLYNFEMVVLRIDMNNTINTSKPCTGCESVVRQMNVGRVWYSNELGNFELLS